MSADEKHNTVVISLSADEKKERAKIGYFIGRLSADTRVGRLSAGLMLSRFYLAADLLLCFHICKTGLLSFSIGAYSVVFSATE